MTVKKFNFTLQALLNVNIALEKEQKNQLTVINNKIRGLFEDRESILSEINQNNMAYMNPVDGSLTISQLRSRNIYLKRLNRDLYDLDQIIQRAEDEKKKIQDTLIESMTKRKTLENLREKQYTEYLKDVSREDEKSIEDFTSNNITQSVEWGAQIEQYN